MLVDGCYRSLRTIALGLVAIGALLISGCGGQTEAKLEDYLEELEFDTPLDSVKEVEIGTYRFSSAARHQDPSGRESEPIWVQIRFKLNAEADYQEEKAIIAACERHRGMLDDAIITVFRKASIDELDDNRWAALKSKLIDTIRPLLGENRIRQISFDDFGYEPI